MNSLCFNGRIYSVEEPLFTAQNRGFRYGDGLFETIRVQDSQVLLAAFHFDRLVTGLRLLKMELPSGLKRHELTEQILNLCRLNGCSHGARVRLAVYRHQQNQAGYVIEAVPLPAGNRGLNESGWTVDIYPYARKSCDALGNLKTANYLPFVLADLHAREHGMDESLLLNVENKICEASKANIFLVLNKDVHTPALHQGCVNGVMRRYLIERMKEGGIRVHQHEVQEALLLEADEVFLTNAINGIRWVGRYREKSYTSNFVRQICLQYLPDL